MTQTGLCRVLLSLLFTSLPTFAQEFYIGVENTQNQPFWWTQEDIYNGQSRELLYAFAASRGYRFHYHPYPVKRLLYAFLVGEADFKFPDNPDWRPDIDVGGRVTYSKPLYTIEEGSLVKADKSGMTAAQVRRLGIVRGWTPIGYLNAIKAGNIRLVQSSSLSALIKMCISDRIDAIYTTKTAYRYELKKLGNNVQPLIFAPGLPQTNSQYMISTIKHPRVIEELNRYLELQPGSLNHPASDNR